ncbi:MAG: tRNA (adenosine(37)-N6)-dimethylallyltransferase MiaA [Pseudomonadota bacterium]
MSVDLTTIPPDQPVLIAGPTASGKSALALQIAEAQGGQIVNADALQVYAGWHVLTARPSPNDLARAPHALYGHVGWGLDYSVGHWLRDLAPLLAPTRPIIVGGTGLYFAALCDGLADIPPIPPAVRDEADALPLSQLLSALDAADPVLAARIDRQNRARVQRGWEVWRATGHPLSAWQAETAPPLLVPEKTTRLLLDTDRDVLAKRIEQRFDIMLENGALEEAEKNLPRWQTAGGEAKAIGAKELISYLRGDLTFAAAREASIIATRQYAKRQRTWFRARMQDWARVAL